MTIEERRELVLKTIRREKTDRVPHLLLSGLYSIYYAGADIHDIKSYDDVIQINKKVWDELQYDAQIYASIPDILCTAPFIEAVGGGCHVVHKGMKQINPEAVAIMEPEEYPELIKDPSKYLLNTILPRRLEMLKLENSEEISNRIMNYMRVKMELGSVIKTLNENGSQVLMGGAYINPVDLIFDCLRDFRGISRDIKKCPELVRDAGLAFVDMYKKMSKMFQHNWSSTIMVPMHLPPFIKPKDFEKIYWPSYKAVTEHMIDQGFNIIFFFEKNYEHLHEYLQELPNKGIIGLFEEDDLKVVKKKLGKTMAIAGGIDNVLLKYGTKEECINNVKSAIDEFGPGGGYFLASDHPLVYKNDANPENLKAICDYINKQ